MENNYYYNTNPNPDQNDSISSTNKNTKKVKTKKEKIKKEKIKKPRSSNPKWTPALLAFMTLFFIMVVFATILFAVEYSHYRRLLKLSGYDLRLAIDPEKNEMFGNFYTVQDPNTLTYDKSRDVYSGRIELNNLTSTNFTNVLKFKNALEIFSVLNYKDKTNPVKISDNSVFELKVIKRKKADGGKKTGYIDLYDNETNKQSLNVCLVDAFNPTYDKKIEGYYVILTHPNKITTYEYKIEKTSDFNTSITRVFTDNNDNREKEQIAIYPKDFFKPRTTSNTRHDFEQEIKHIIEENGIDSRFSTSLDITNFWLISDTVNYEGRQELITRLLPYENYFAPQHDNSEKCKFNYLNELYVTAARPGEKTFEIHTLDPIQENTTIPFAVMFAKLDNLNKIDKKSFSLINNVHDFDKFIKIIQESSFNPETEEFAKWIEVKEGLPEFKFSNTFQDQSITKFQIYPNIVRKKFNVYFFKNTDQLRQYFSDPTGFDKNALLDKLILEREAIITSTLVPLFLSDDRYMHRPDNWSLIESKEMLDNTLQLFLDFNKRFDPNRKKDFYFVPIIKAGLALEFVSYYETTDSSEKKEYATYTLTQSQNENYGYKGDQFIVPTTSDVRNDFVEGGRNERPVKWVLDPVIRNDENYSSFYYLAELEPGSDKLLDQDNEQKNPVILRFYPVFQYTRLNVTYLLEDINQKDDSDPISYIKAEEHNATHYYQTHKYIESQDYVIERDLSELSWFADDKKSIRDKLINNSDDYIAKLMLISDQVGYENFLGYEIDRTTTYEKNNAENQKIKIDCTKQTKPQEILIYLKRKKFTININYRIRHLSEKDLTVLENGENSFTQSYYFGNQRLLISSENKDKLSLVQSYTNDGWSQFREYKSNYNPSIPSQFAAGDYERKWNNLDKNDYISFEGDKALYRYVNDLNLDNDIDINFYVCYKKLTTYSAVFFQSVDNVLPNGMTDYDYHTAVSKKVDGNQLLVSSIEEFNEGGVYYYKTNNSRKLRVGEFYDHSQNPITSSVTLIEDKQPIYVRYFAPIQVSLFHLAKQDNLNSDAYFSDGSHTKNFYPNETFSYVPNVPDYNQGNEFDAWDIFADEINNSPIAHAKTKTFTLEDQDKRFNIRSSFKYFIYELKFFNDGHYNSSTHELDFNQIDVNLIPTYSGRENGKIFNLKLKIDDLSALSSEKYSYLLSYRLFKEYTRLKFNNDNNTTISDLQSFELFNHRKTVIECYLLRNEYGFDFVGKQPGGGIQNYPKQIKYIGEKLSFNTFQKIRGYKIEDKINFIGSTNTLTEVDDGNIKSLFNQQTFQNFGAKNSFFNSREDYFNVKYNNQILNTHRSCYSIEIQASYQAKDTIKVEVYNVIELHTNISHKYLSNSEYSPVNQQNYELPYITSSGNTLQNASVYNLMKNSYPTLFSVNYWQGQIGDLETKFWFANKIAVVDNKDLGTLSQNAVTHNDLRDYHEKTNWNEETGEEKLIIYFFHYAPYEITNPEVKQDRRYAYPGQMIQRDWFIAPEIQFINFDTASPFATKQTINQVYEFTGLLVTSDMQKSSGLVQLLPLYVPFTVDCHYLIRDFANPHLFDIKSKRFDKYYRNKNNSVIPTKYRFIDEIITSYNSDFSLTPQINKDLFTQTTDSNTFNEHRRLIGSDDYTLNPNTEVYAYPQKQSVNFIGSTTYRWFYSDTVYQRNQGILEHYFYTCIPKLFVSSEKVHRRINGQDEGFIGWKKLGEITPVNNETFFSYTLVTPLQVEANFNPSSYAPDKISFDIIDKNGEKVFTEPWHTKITNNGNGIDIVTLDCPFRDDYGAKIVKFFIPKNGGLEDEANFGTTINYADIISPTIKVEFAKRTLLDFKFTTDSAIQSLGDLDEASLAKVKNIRILPGNVYTVEELFISTNRHLYHFVSIRYGSQEFTAVEGHNKITISADDKLYIKFVKNAQVSIIVNGVERTDNLTDPSALNDFRYLIYNKQYTLPSIYLKENNLGVTNYYLYNASNHLITTLQWGSNFSVTTDQGEKFFLICEFNNQNCFVDYVFFGKANDFTLLTENQRRILNDNLIVNHNSTFPLPNPFIDGYKFIKWTYTITYKFANTGINDVVTSKQDLSTYFKFDRKTMHNNYVIQSVYYTFEAEFKKQPAIVWRGLGPEDNTFSYLRDAQQILFFQNLRFTSPGEILKLIKLSVETGLDHFIDGNLSGAAWQITYSKDIPETKTFKANTDYIVENIDCDKYIISPQTKPLVTITYNLTHVGGGNNTFDIIGNTEYVKFLQKHLLAARGEEINFPVEDLQIGIYQANRFSWEMTVNKSVTTVIGHNVIIPKDANEITFSLKGKQKVIINYDFSALDVSVLNDFSKLTLVEQNNLKNYRYFNDNDNFNPLTLNLGPIYETPTWVIIKNGNQQLSIPYTINQSDTVLTCKLVVLKKIIVTYNFDSIGRGANDFSFLTSKQISELQNKLYIPHNQLFTITFIPTISGYQAIKWRYSDNIHTNYKDLQNYTPNNNVTRVNVRLDASPLIKVNYDFSVLGLPENDFRFLTDFQKNLLQQQMSLSYNDTFQITFEPTVTGYRFVKWTYRIDNEALENIIQTGDHHYTVTSATSKITIKLHLEKALTVKYKQFGSSENTFDYVLSPDEQTLQQAFKQYVYKSLQPGGVGGPDQFTFPDIVTKNKHFLRRYLITYVYGSSQSHNKTYILSNNNSFSINPQASSISWDTIKYIEVNPVCGNFINLTYEFNNPAVNFDLIDFSQKEQLNALKNFNPYVTNTFPSLDIANNHFVKYMYQLNDSQTLYEFNTHWTISLANPESVNKIKVRIYVKTRVKTKLVIADTQDDEAKKLLSDYGQLALLNAALANSFIGETITLPAPLTLNGFTFNYWIVELKTTYSILQTLTQTDLSTNYSFVIDNDNVKEIIFKAVIDLSVSYNINGVFDYSNLLDPEQVAKFRLATRLKREDSATILLPDKVKVHNYEFVSYRVAGYETDSSFFTLVGGSWELSYNKIKQYFANKQQITIKVFFELTVSKGLVCEQDQNTNLLLHIDQTNYNRLMTIATRTTNNQTKYKTNPLPNIEINGFELKEYRLQYYLNGHQSPTLVTKNKGEIFDITVPGGQVLSNIQITAVFNKRSTVSIVFKFGQIISELSDQQYTNDYSQFLKYRNTYVSSTNQNVNFNSFAINPQYALNGFELKTNGSHSLTFNINQPVSLDLYGKAYQIQIVIRTK